MSDVDGQEGERGILAESAAAHPDLIVGSARLFGSDEPFRYYIQKENSTSNHWDQMLTHPKSNDDFPIVGFFVDIQDTGYAIWTNDAGTHTPMMKDAREKHLTEITDNTPLISFDIDFPPESAPVVRITSFEPDDRLTKKFARYLGRNISHGTPISVIEERVAQPITPSNLSFNRHTIDIRTPE